MSNESIMSAQRQVDAAMEQIKVLPKEGILVQIRITPEQREVKDEFGMVTGVEEKFHMHLHLDDDLLKEVKAKNQILELYENLHTIKCNIGLQDGVLTPKQLSEKGIPQITLVKKQ